MVARLQAEWLAAATAIQQQAKQTEVPQKLAQPKWEQVLVSVEI